MMWMGYQGYAYIITPSGLEEKAKVTVWFLKRKLEEHEEIQATIEQVKEDVADTGRLPRNTEWAYLSKNTDFP